MQALGELGLSGHCHTCQPERRFAKGVPAQDSCTDSTSANLICVCHKAETLSVPDLSALSSGQHITPDVLRILESTIQDMAKTLIVPGRRVGTAQSQAAHVRAQLMALSSSFDSVLVRAKGVSLQPTCVRMCRAA